MWSRITQAAEYVAGVSDEQKPEEEKKVSTTMEEAQEQIEQQNVLIEQLKSFLRKTEENLQAKEKEFAELSAKHQRSQIQSKAKIANLTSQLKEKSPKAKEDADFDDASSSDSSDQSTRGRVILLKKQLESAKQQLDKQDKEHQRITKALEDRISELESELKSKDNIASSEASSAADQKAGGNAPEGSSIQEMYAQIVYKDSKILELNNQILEHERKILDLQEHIREKDEVLQSRNLAVQLISADMSKKGKTVADELEETRDQMKNMQSNFADAEVKWKEEKDALKSLIADAKAKSEEEMQEKENTLQQLEEAVKKLEAVRYELATRNAELQKKIVLIEENADKKLQAYCKKSEEELQRLQQDLEKEKEKSSELQKALKDASSQSESKVLKARVKERTKLKALERELEALKKLQSENQKPEEVTKLQQQVAILEEEKGTLQLKLIEVDEQISMQDKLKAENAKLTGLLSEAQQKVSILERARTDTEAEKSSWKLKFEEQEGSYNILKSGFEKLSEENVTLLKDLEELKIVKEDLENKVSLLEGSINDLSSRNSEILKESAAMKDDKVALEMKVIELEEIREREEKEKDELLGKIESLQHKLESDISSHVKAEMQLMESRCAELQGLLDSAKKHEDEVTGQVSHLKAEISELSSQLKAAEEKEAQLSENNQSLLTDLNVSEAKITDLERSLLEGISESQEKGKHCAVLATTVESLQNQLKAAYSMMRVETEEEFREQSAEFTKLKDDVSAFSEREAELRHALSSKDLELESCQESIKNLGEQLQQIQELHVSLQQEAESLKKSIHVLEDEKKALENSVVEKDRAISDLRVSLEEKELKITQLGGDFENALLRLTAVEQEKLTSEQKTTNIKTSLLEQITDLETEISELKTEIERGNEQLDDSKKEINNLQLQLENVTRSNIQKESFYQSACEEKDQVICKLQENLTVVRSDTRKREEEHEAELGNISKQCEELTSLLKQHEQREFQLNASLERTTEEVNALKQNVTAKKQREHELESCLADVNEELNALKQMMAAKEQREHELETSLSSVSEEVNILRQSTAAKEADIVSLRNELHSKNHAHSMDIENIKNKHEMELNAAVAEHEEKRSVLEQRLASLNEEISCMKGRLSTLQNEKDSLHREKSVHEKTHAELESFKDKYRELEIRLAEHEEKRSASEALLADAHKKISMLEEKISAKESETKTLENELQKTAADYEAEFDNMKKMHEEELTARSVRYEENLSILEASLAKANEEMEVLSKKLSAKEMEIETLRNELHSKDAGHKAELEEIKSKFEAERKTSSTQYQEQMSRTSKLVARLAEASEEINSLKEQRYSLQVENQNLDIMVEGLKSQIKLEKERAEDLAVKYDSARNALEELDDELSRANQQISMLQDKIASSNFSVSEKEELYNSVLQQKLSLEHQNLKLSEEVASLKAQIAENDSASKDLSEALSARETEIAKLHQEKELLLKEHCKEIEKFRSGLSNSQKSLQNRTEELDCVKTQLQNLMEEYSQLNESMSLLRTDEKSLREENELLTSQLRGLQQKHLTGLKNVQNHLTVLRKNVEAVKGMHISSIEEAKTLCLNTQVTATGRFEELLHAVEEAVRQIGRVKEENKLLEARALASEARIENLESSSEKLAESLKCELDKQVQRCKQLETFREKCLHLVSKMSVPGMEAPAFDRSDISTEETVCKYLESTLQSILSLHSVVESLEKKNSLQQLELQNMSAAKEETEQELKSVKQNYREMHNSSDALISERNSYTGFLNTLASEIFEISDHNAKICSTTSAKLDTLFEKLGKVETLFKNHAHVFRDSCAESHAVSEEQAKLEMQIRSFYEKTRPVLSHSNVSASLSIPENLQEFLQAVFSEICISKSELQEKESMLSAMQRELDMHNMQQSDMENHIKHITTENSQCREQFEKKCMDYEQHISILNEELQSLISKNSILHQEIQSIRDTEDKCQKFQRELEHAKSLIAELSAKCSKHVDSTAETAVQCEGDACETCVALKAELEKCRNAELQSQESYKAAVNCIQHISDALLQSASEYSEGQLRESVVIPDSANPTEIQKMAGKLKTQVVNCVVSSRKSEECIETYKRTVTSLEKSLKALTSEKEALLSEIAQLRESMVSAVKESSQRKDGVEISEKDQSGCREIVTGSDVPDVPFERAVLVQSSAQEPAEKLQILDQEKTALQQELEASKTKCDKLLVKLKAFKNRSDKLVAEVKDLTAKNGVLESRLAESLRLAQDESNLVEENSKLHSELALHREQEEMERCRVASIIENLEKEKSEVLSERDTLAKDIQECRSSIESLSSSLHLQEEENQQLACRLKERENELESSREFVLRLQGTQKQMEIESQALHHEVENLREHTGMLMSDNETFQKLVEKLNHTKNTLEKEIAKEKERYSTDVKNFETLYQEEHQKVQALQSELNEEAKLVSDLRVQCSHLQLQNEALGVKLEDALFSKRTLEERVKSLSYDLANRQAELDSLGNVEKVDISVQNDSFSWRGTAARITDSVIQCDIQSAAVESRLEESTVNVVHTGSQCDVSPVSDAEELQASEITDLRLQIKVLSDELMDARSRLTQHAENENIFRVEWGKMDKHYRHVIADLQQQIEQYRHAESISVSPKQENRSSPLEMELQQAMSSLHKQNVRLEEMNLEFNKLLEERNTLKLKLSQYQQQFHQIQLEHQSCKREHASLLRSSDSVPEDGSVKVEIPIEGSGDGPPSQISVPHQRDTEIARLHQRLLEAEKTCQELRKANEALDTALFSEKEQRKAVEEELGYAQKQLLPEETVSKDEYRLLLEDLGEPERFVETNFAVSRKVKSHAFKFRRWLRGRRAYLVRSFHGKRYSELLYIFYIFTIHLWLLLCLVRHS